MKETSLYLQTQSYCDLFFLPICTFYCHILRRTNLPFRKWNYIWVLWKAAFVLNLQAPQLSIRLDSSPEPSLIEIH